MMSRCNNDIHKLRCCFDDGNYEALDQVNDSIRAALAQFAEPEREREQERGVMSTVIEDIQDFLEAGQRVRLVIESDDEGGIDVAFFDVGGQVIEYQLWVDYCGPDDNLEAVLKSCLEQMREDAA